MLRPCLREPAVCPDKRFLAYSTAFRANPFRFRVRPRGGILGCNQSRT